MGLEDLGKKAGEFLSENADKIQDALHSEQAEQISDKLLDGAENLANKVTGGSHADQIADLKQQADGAIGNE